MFPLIRKMFPLLHSCGTSSDDTVIGCATCSSHSLQIHHDTPSAPTVSFTCISFMIFKCHQCWLVTHALKDDFLLSKAPQTSLPLRVTGSCYLLSYTCPLSPHIGRLLPSVGIYSLVLSVYKSCNGLGSSLHLFTTLFTHFISSPLRIFTYLIFSSLHIFNIFIP